MVAAGSIPGARLCVRCVPRAGRAREGGKEEKSDRESRRSERAAFSVKGAVSGAAIEAERLPCYAMERRTCCVCVRAAACRAIIVHRCNLKRIARGLVEPEVPNDLGLLVMRVERRTNGRLGWYGQAGRLTITNANGSDELIYLH